MQIHESKNRSNKRRRSDLPDYMGILCIVRFVIQPFFNLDDFIVLMSVNRNMTTMRLASMAPTYPQLRHLLAIPLNLNRLGPQLPPGCRHFRNLRALRFSWPRDIQHMVMMASLVVSIGSFLTDFRIESYELDRGLIKNTSEAAALNSLGHLLRLATVVNIDPPNALVDTFAEMNQIPSELTWTPYRRSRLVSQIRDFVRLLILSQLSMDKLVTFVDASGSNDDVPDLSSFGPKLVNLTLPENPGSGYFNVMSSLLFLWAGRLNKDGQDDEYEDSQNPSLWEDEGNKDPRSFLVCVMRTTRWAAPGSS